MHLDKVTYLGVERDEFVVVRLDQAVADAGLKRLVIADYMPTVKRRTG